MYGVTSNLGGASGVFLLMVLWPFLARHAAGLYKDPSEGILQPEAITEQSQDSEMSEEDMDEDDDEEEGDDTEDVDPETLKHLPTPCHVCRLLVREVESRLLKFGKVKKLRKNKSPIYHRKEKVILLAIQELCQEMNKYRVRSSHPFRYKKGVKSHFRDVFDEATKDSKVKKWMWLTPEGIIDDPTGEIDRLAKQCHAMLVEHQFNLVEWFMTAQSQDLTSWLCFRRVLKDQNQDCLTVELPRKKAPVKTIEDDLKEKESNKDESVHLEL